MTSENLSSFYQELEQVYDIKGKGTPDRPFYQNSYGGQEQTSFVVSSVYPFIKETLNSSSPIFIQVITGTEGRTHASITLSLKLNSRQKQENGQIRTVVTPQVHLDKYSGFRDDGKSPTQLDSENLQFSEKQMSDAAATEANIAAQLAMKVTQDSLTTLYAKLATDPDYARHLS